MNVRVCFVRAYPLAFTCSVYEALPLTVSRASGIVSNPTIRSYPCHTSSSFDVVRAKSDMRLCRIWRACSVVDDGGMRGEWKVRHTIDPIRRAPKISAARRLSKMWEIIGRRWKHQWRCVRHRYIELSYFSTCGRASSHDTCTEKVCAHAQFLVDQKKNYKGISSHVFMNDNT